MSTNPPKIKQPESEPAEHPIFGKVIYAYSRAQAVLDGFQVDVSETAREAGIKFPVFLNRSVWDAYVKVPSGVSCQDEEGRLWDIVWMLRFAMRKAKDGETSTRVALYVRNYVRNSNTTAKLVTLKAMCGPLDMDKPEPAITIMLIDED